MHNKNILHRDIKSDNILVRPNGEIKLADLGFSVFLSEQEAYRKSQRGTPSWVSPEIVNGTFYTKEVDVWALGCLAYELATGQPPFHAYAKDNNTLFDAIINVEAPPLPEHCGPGFADFVKKCLMKSAADRWTIN